MPFGLRHGARNMQAVSSSLKKEGINTLPYIDDIVGVEKDEDTAWRSFHRATQLLEELGLEEAKKKRCPPTHCFIWLGIEFNTTTGIKRRSMKC